MYSNLLLFTQEWPGQMGWASGRNNRSIEDATTPAGRNKTIDMLTGICACLDDEDDEGADRLARSLRWMFMWPPRAWAFVKPILQYTHLYDRLLHASASLIVAASSPCSLFSSPEGLEVPGYADSAICVMKSDQTRNFPNQFMKKKKKNGKGKKGNDKRYN